MLTILLLGLSSVVALAQNKVTVNQQGSGNSVSINQGAEKKSTDNDCKEAKIDAEGSNNTIKVTKAGDKQQTVLHQSTTQRNNLSAFLLDLHMLEALQKGEANSISIILPDSGTAPHTFSTSQHGNANKFSARMTSSPTDVSVSQNGSGNSLAINPCESKEHQ